MCIRDREGSVSKARDVIRADEEIDQMEKDIERLCLKLLLQQQPVAKDLRQISAALKMITDMERIGDQASDIAEIIISEKRSEATEIPKIGQMSEAAAKMVRDSVSAYVRKDLELSRKVVEADDAVDMMFVENKQELIDFIAVSYTHLCLCEQALICCTSAPPDRKIRSGQRLPPDPQF